MALQLTGANKKSSFVGLKQNSAPAMLNLEIVADHIRLYIIYYILYYYYPANTELFLKPADCSSYTVFIGLIFFPSEIEIEKKVRCYYVISKQNRSANVAM